MMALAFLLEAILAINVVCGDLLGEAVPDEMEDASLLQIVKWSLSLPGGATQEVEKIKPIAWLHVPKCGTSFFNNMLHTPGICPGVPADCVVDATTFCPNLSEGKGLKGQRSSNCGFFMANFESIYPVKQSCGDSLYVPKRLGSHVGVGNEYESHYKGHGVTLLRQPEQRILSGFHDGLKDYAPGQNALPEPQAPLEYARIAQGCAVRMLTRDDASDQYDNVCGQMPLPSAAELSEAQRRLRGFAFVGITEMWNLSMCLWRVKFGGLCYGSDFQDIRPGTAHDGNGYSTEQLGNWTDPYDGELYELALQLFRDDLQKHRVTEATCEPCFQHAREHWAPQSTDGQTCQVMNAQA